MGKSADNGYRLTTGQAIETRLSEEMWVNRVNKTTHLAIIGLCMLVSGTASTYAQQTGNSDNNAASYREVLDQYCVSCHNQTLKTAGMILDKANLANVSEDPLLWERVMTKLTLRAMPPVGFPMRPDEAVYEEFLAYLQTELDGAARAELNPGRPPIHRLNRIEYANAIRDILDFEIDVAALLPSDNVSEGFDNIAEVLSVSPLLMERYMFAAGRISNLAVGPPAMQPASESYEVSSAFLQMDRMSDDLPFGSRGGTAIQHRFPLDGEYVISVDLQKNAEGYIRGMHQQHTLDILLNHERIGRFKIGGERHARSGPLFTGRQNALFSGDRDQIAYEFLADDSLQIRLPVKAGSHLVGVTFVDEGAKQTTIQTPQLKLIDMFSYKGGDPGVSSVTITGPYAAKGPGQTASRNKIFICHPAEHASVQKQEECAGTILSTLARQAYRRPVTNQDMDHLLGLFRQGRNEDGFESGIELAIQGILVGPEFLFRIERDPPGIAADKAYPLSDLELASRLSFFLWSTIPDEELLEVASQGKLRNPAVLEQQVQRMIASPRFKQFVDNFGEQYLSIRNIDIAEPNPQIFPEFDEELRVALKQEMRLWFDSMIRNDSSVLELLTSDYTYVNERLAQHYGITGVNGSRYRRVSVNRPERNGLMGKGGMLLATSFNNRTSPVLRGIWVLENLLNMPPPPAPDDVPALEVSESGQALTLKQAMEKHRANPVCSSCHKLMDPIGLALEHFDAIGLYRDRYADANAEVDASGILFDGSEFRTTLDFQQEFMEHSERVVHTVTEKVLTYALGRRLEHYDLPVVRNIVREISPENYTWSSLILEVINSTPFQYRRASSHVDI